MPRASPTGSSPRSSGGHPTGRLRRPAGALWSNADFIKLWTGQSISELGSQISQLAIPIVAAIALHASPIVFSLLGVFGFLPFMIFALPAGAWVDRMRRRRILIAGDAARAIVLATIPVAYAFGVLTIWQLLVVQFVVGIFTVFFDVAYQSYLPQLVHRDHLIESNSKLQLTVSVAQVAGPGMAGGLIAAITAPYAIVADAISFVVSTVFLIRIRTAEHLPQRAEGAPKPRMWPEVKEGLNWVVHNPYLRRIAVCTGTSNLFGSLGFAIFVLYALRSLHLPPWEIGLVFGAGSVGAIIGALLVNRIQKTIGVGPAIIVMALLVSTAGILVPLAPRPFPLPLLIASFFVTQFGGVAYNITQVSLRQAITPERLQGRMNAAMRWIVWGTIPLGTLAGGALATAFTLRTALFVGAIGCMPTFLFVAFSPLRNLREMPAPITSPTQAQAEMEGGLIEPAPMITEPRPPAPEDA
jgi:MFS family permease